MQQQRFDLNLDNDNEKRLSEHLSRLAEDGEKGKWIVRTLVAALPDVDVHAALVKASGGYSQYPVSDHDQRKRRPDIRDFDNAFERDENGDVRYEDIEE